MPKKPSKLTILKTLKSRFTPVQVLVSSDDTITCPECSSVFSFTSNGLTSSSFSNACCPCCGKALELKSDKGGVK